MRPVAEMIPESLRGLPRVTAGESRLFRLLQQKLDDETLVWFNVPVRGRYVDFVVLDPKRGLLVLEVKDWRLSQLRSVTPNRIRLVTPSGEKAVTHPLRQVRDYALRVVDTLAADPTLIAHDGPYQGRLAMPFGYGVMWTHVGEWEFRLALPEMVESPMLFCELLASTLAKEEFAVRLFSLLPFTFPCSLTTEQVDRIRHRIFPEVRLPRPRRLPPAEQPRLFAVPEESLAVMDLEQERLAKQLGEGHRLLRGVAGSGKTVTLVCRARLLAGLNPHWRILVLCYNVSLASYLRQTIGERRVAGAAIDVENFHAFLAPLVRAEGIARTDGPEWADDAADALSDRAASGAWSPPRYDAILIDEAQDFRPSWLRLAVACLNPETNSLFVVHDSAQNIYRNGFSFKRVGIQIRGRTRVLRTNYRNTRSIARLAAAFLSLGVPFVEGEGVRDDEGQFLEIVRPRATRRSGPEPQLVECASFREECAETAARVKHWIERGHYAPSDIAILYVRRGAAAGDDRYIRALLDALGEAGVPHEWISRDRRSKRALSIDSAAVKVSTIHSAKGLDFGAVALVGLSMLPSSPEHADAERSLVYVGLTRARESLLITYCKESQFVRELKECLASGEHSS